MLRKAKRGQYFHQSTHQLPKVPHLPIHHMASVFKLLVKLRSRYPQVEWVSSKELGKQCVQAHHHNYRVSGKYVQNWLRASWALPGTISLYKTDKNNRK